MDTEKPTTYPLLELPGSERLAAHRARAAREAALRADLEKLKAEHHATASNPLTEQLRRIGAMLDGLDATLQDQQEQAASDAKHYAAANMVRNQQFHEGRTAAFHQARHLARQAWTQALYGTTLGNTRQDNAAAFAETIINQTGAAQ